MNLEITAGSRQLKITQPSLRNYSFKFKSAFVKAGLKCPSVRPQNVSSISIKFGLQVEVDE